MGGISTVAVYRVLGCTAGVMTGFDVAEAMEFGVKGTAVSVVGCGMIGHAVGSEAARAELFNHNSSNIEPDDEYTSIQPMK